MLFKQIPISSRAVVREYQQGSVAVVANYSHADIQDNSTTTSVLQPSYDSCTNKKLILIERKTAKCSAYFCSAKGNRSRMSRTRLIACQLARLVSSYLFVHSC